MELSKMEKIIKWITFQISFILSFFLIFAYILDNYFLFGNRRPFVDNVWSVIGYIFIILFLNLIINIIYYKRIKHPLISLILNIAGLLFIYIFGQSFNPY